MIEDRQKLFALEGAARLDERMHCKVQADYGEDCFNRGALMVGKVIFVVLTYQGRGAENRKKDEGFDVFLVLEATIGLNKHDEETAAPQLVSSRKKNAEPEFSINAHDVRFLKSLRISADEAA